MPRSRQRKGNGLKGECRTDALGLSRRRCQIPRWERNRIERMIGHLKINRAIATRYDKLARSFLDALHIAAIRRCLRYATL
jgi:transposase